LPASDYVGRRVLIFGRFHIFFHHLDHFRTDYFLWVTAEGIAAARQSKARSELLDEDASDSEPDANGQEG
jgi:tRNA pseudouridine38-40 synthase